MGFAMKNNFFVLKNHLLVGLTKPYMHDQKWIFSINQICLRINKGAVKKLT